RMSYSQLPKGGGGLFRSGSKERMRRWKRSKRSEPWTTHKGGPNRQDSRPVGRSRRPPKRNSTKRRNCISQDTLPRASSGGSKHNEIVPLTRQVKQNAASRRDRSGPTPGRRLTSVAASHKVCNRNGTPKGRLRRRCELSSATPAGPTSWTGSARRPACHSSALKNRPGRLPFRANTAFQK